MPEFRQNPLTGQWVIVAGERADRPNAVPADVRRRSPVAHDDDCAFCPGHEHRTPPEVYAVRDDYATTDREGWRVRVIPNKYPALSIDAEGAVEPEPIVSHARDMAKAPGRQQATVGPPRPRPGALGPEALSDDVQAEGVLRVAKPGVGMHEVVIESPAHDAHFARHDAEQAVLIVQALRHRFRMMMQARDVQMVCIFKNHGPRSGGTIEHPHFQIIATALVPPLAESMIDRQAAHAEQTGQPLFETLLAEESASGERIIAANDGFVTLAPWACQSPYEMWIIPRDPMASFGDLPDDATTEFAASLQDALRRIARALKDPDYNLVIHSAPKGLRAQRFHRWFVQVVPRLVTVAGFEHGTHLFINQVPPEEAAEELRMANSK